MPNLYKHTVFCILTFSFVTSLAWVQAQTPISANFEDSFQVGKDIFLIKAKKSFVTLASGPGEKIEFSVYHNKKFMHPTDPNGGVLIGCRQPFATPKDENPIQKLQVSGSIKGWWIHTKETCGNRSRQFYQAIIPQHMESTYSSRVFDSNFMGIFARNGIGGNSIEVWTFNYGEDCGAATLSYPKMEVLEGQSSLPENQSQWPRHLDFTGGEKKADSVYPLNFANMVLAGITNKNIPLLKAALLKFDATSFKSNEGCHPLFGIKNKKDLESLIVAYETLDKLGLLASKP